MFKMQMAERNPYPNKSTVRRVQPWDKVFIQIFGVPQEGLKCGMAEKHHRPTLLISIPWESEDNHPGMWTNLTPEEGSLGM